MSEIERKLLAKLLDPQQVTEAWDAGVRSEHFEEPLYQAVWNFTTTYWQQFQMQSAPTSWALAQEFPGYTITEEVPEETEYLAALLLRRFAANRGQDMIRRAATTMATDPEGSLKMLQGEVIAATESLTPRLTRINMGETIQQRRERYAQRDAHPQGVGVGFGIDLLDLHTGGVYPSELVVVGAYAKTGKTMFLLNAAVDAVRKGLRPVVFSLELSLEDTQERLDAMYSGVSYQRLNRGNLSIDELRTLHAAQEELRDRGGLIVERPEEGDRTVPALLARAHQLGADFLIIDQLSKMEAGHRTNTKKEEYSSILRQLTNGISRVGQEIPCLLATQTRREEGEPTIQSFADAAEVERDCDMALTLWRNRDLLNNHLMKVTIVAGRRCEETAFLCSWELQNYTRIRATEEVR